MKGTVKANKNGTSTYTNKSGDTYKMNRKGEVTYIGNSRTTPKKTTAKKVAPKKERHSDVGMKRAAKRNKRKTRSDKGKVRQSTIERWNRNAPLYD